MLGAAPQDLTCSGDPSYLIIGARCRIFEYAHLSGGTATLAGGVTTLGDAAVLRRVEEAVEVLARAGLEASCALEQKQQQRHVDLARRRPKGEERDALLEKALAFEMASCDRLAQFGAARPGAGREAAAAA